MNCRLPLVVILGATGSGKTKLSLELAKLFNGEIIGADSMQVYKALDIITAKATSEERSQAPHHLIDILSPHEYFSVLDFRNRAVGIIDEIFSKQKVPILVGGTNYYIESVLWKILVEECDHSKHIKRFTDIYYKYHELESTELHKMLHKLDPAMSKRLHPNNKRKILRSIEVLLQKDKKHSEILREQQNSAGGSLLGGGLRYPNSIVFWLQCDQKILDERLNERVDKMLGEGLVNELLNFHNEYNVKRIDKEPDYTKGIFQSIGFKEFHKYLMLKDTERFSDAGKQIFQTGLEELKIATRRYARKQVKWIKNRFLIQGRQAPPVYGLDTTDVSNWNCNVIKPAVEILKCYLEGGVSTQEAIPLRDVEIFPNALDDTHICEVCNRTFVGKLQWEIHKKSNKHKKMVQRMHKKDDVGLKKNQKTDV